MFLLALIRWNVSCGGKKGSGERLGKSPTREEGHLIPWLDVSLYSTECVCGKGRRALTWHDQDDGAAMCRWPFQHLLEWGYVGFAQVQDTWVSHFIRWWDKAILVSLHIRGQPIIKENLRNKMLKVNHQQVLWVVWIRWQSWSPDRDF